MMPQLRTIGTLALSFLAACATAARPDAEGAGPSSAGGEQSVVAAGVEPAHQAERAKAAPSAKSSVEGAASSRPPRSEYDTPLQDCQIESDYNECIVERLQGRTRSEKELMVLIQSQRMLGDIDAAKRNMETFIERYPDSPMVDSYRNYLETP